MDVLNLGKASVESSVNVKTLMGSVRAPKPGKIHWLYHVYGFAYSTVSGIGEKGAWVRFHGDFLAHTLNPVGRKDPAIKMIRAPVWFPPDAAALKLMGAGLAPEDTFIKFGVRVGVEHATTTLSGYNDVAEFLFDPDLSSPMDMLLKFSDAPAETLAAEEAKPGWQDDAESGTRDHRDNESAVTESGTRTRRQKPAAA